LAVKRQAQPKLNPAKDRRGLDTSSGKRMIALRNNGITSRRIQISKVLDHFSTVSRDDE
jgi:hypothetical protein